MESRFTPLLSTNYVPSKDELNEIHKLLEDPVDQLVRLDAEIARLQNIIGELSLKRNQLHTDIVRHGNLIAPLRRIPEELLQEIFLRCLPVDHNAVMSCHEAPLLLGRVCSQWRSVSISTPRLWSGIHIVVTTGAPSPTPWPNQSPHEADPKFDVVEAVGVWLSRSGGLPLSISLFQAPYIYPPSQHTDQLISMLVQFSTRWKHLSLLVSPAMFLPLSSLSREVVPLLEMISVQESPSDITPPSDILPLDIFRAPRIQTWSSCNLGIIPKRMDWSRLTSLSLGSLSQSMERALTPLKALEILGKCLSLVHCSLEFGWVATPPLNYHDIVMMPLLETLSIDEGHSNLTPFFGQLRLPALAKLVFTASLARDTPDPHEDPSICILLSQINSLKELTLSTMNLTRTIVMRCLQHIPSITRLSIFSPPVSNAWHEEWPPQSSGQPFQDEVLHLLTPVENQPPVCPRLKVLECNPGGMSDAALLTFIQQRTIHASTHDIQPLHRVDIIFRRPREVDIKSALPPDVAAEMIIALNYWPDYPSPAPRRHLTPRAGLEQSGRLEMPIKSSRYYSN